ncbi:hypothetical protein Aple_058650 [Acrocarpospora pleiomorpha]|uniref:Uncharacterized protein n=1 Tax=Acrocarpospora pleiomorpha TaxID=90975 RepID=A0A5M3XQC9_9ACTN|nr:hypothetical protein Aple_058650 [Acrocarpospora pleiomorpha]
MGLGDDFFGGQGCAEAVGGGAGVGGPFVEEVRAVRDGIADWAAEEVAYGAADGFALDVEGGYLEWGVDAVDALLFGGHSGQAVEVADGVSGYCGYMFVNLVLGVDVEAGDG